MNSISNGNSMLMLQANMQALLMADSALNRAQIQGSAANALDGRANVLESEIKTGNGNLEAMKQKMEGLREAAQDARSSQAGTLGSAIEVLNENSTADKTKAQNPSAAANVPAYEDHTIDQTEETEGKKKEEGRYDEVTITAYETEGEDTSAPVVSGAGREGLPGWSLLV